MAIFNFLAKGIRLRDSVMKFKILYYWEDIMGKNEKLVELMSKTLGENEKVITYVDGAFETKVNGKTNVKTGILAITNEKIRFCGKRLFFLYDDSIDFDEILEVSLTEEKLGYNIFIKGKEKPYFMKYVVDKEVHNFVEKIKEKINK